jgi:hypothetical protein
LEGIPDFAETHPLKIFDVRGGKFSYAVMPQLQQA